MGQLRGIDKQVMEMHLEVEKNDEYAFERAFGL